MILIAAVVFDLKTGRIPNKLILTGYLAGILLQVIESGPAGIFIFFQRAGSPIMLLYVLYYIKALGAGDVKLYSVTAVYFPFSQMKYVFLYSFLLGAAASLVRVLQKRQLRIRLWKLWDYASDCMEEHSLLRYQTLPEAASFLHFSIYIMLGSILTMCQFNF